MSGIGHSEGGPERFSEFKPYDSSVFTPIFTQELKESVVPPFLSGIDLSNATPQDIINHINGLLESEKPNAEELAQGLAQLRGENSQLLYSPSDIATILHGTGTTNANDIAQALFSVENSQGETFFGAMAIATALASVKDAEGNSVFDAQAITDALVSLKRSDGQNVFSNEDIVRAVSCLVNDGYSSVDVIKALASPNTFEGLDLSASSLGDLFSNSNFSAEELAAGFKQAGVSAVDTADALEQMGFSANEIAVSMKEAGFNAFEIALGLKEAGFNGEDTKGALKEAGFSWLESKSAMRNAGFEVRPLFFGGA